MGIGYNPKIVTNGLVLCLDAANRKSYPGSGTTWFDLGKNFRNGTFNNGTTFSSVNNGTIVFDGVDDFIELSNWGILTGNASYTYDLFFQKRSNVDSNWVSYGTRSNNSMNQVGIFNNTIGILNYANDTTIAASEILNNVWYQMTATHDGTTTKLYFNAILRNQKSTTYTFGSTNLFLGRAAGAGTTYNAPISLSSLKIYDRALSAAEIQQNFNAIRGRYGI